MTPQMLFLLTLMVLLFVKWDTVKRASAVWIGTSWTTLMTIAAIGKPFAGLKKLGGAYGSLRMVVWAHLMLGIAVWWLVRDDLLAS